MRLVEGVAAVDDLDGFLADLDAVADEHGCTVQAFDARYVVSEEHLARALELADRAVERGENVARDRAVEVLLYAAGRRQIDDALEMGVGEGETPVVVLVAAEENSVGGRSDETGRGADGVAVDETAAVEAVESLLRPASTLGAFDRDRVWAFFSVTDRELSATDGTLADVVLERVALLDVEK